MADKNPVQVSPDKHFVEYNKTMIQIPKPIEQMSNDDWMRLALGEKSTFNQVEIDHQSFIGLHVVLKDKNYLPVWLYDSRGKNDIPRAFDTLERAIQLGAQLISSIDDIEAPKTLRASADGHFHRDDVILAKIPIVAYYAMQRDNVRRSQSSIEYQAAEGKAFEAVDMPHYIKGNKEAPLYEATEHSVKYQDRPRF